MSFKEGWTGLLVAARYGFANIVRELITKFGCDRNAVVEVSGPCPHPGEQCCLTDVLLMTCRVVGMPSSLLPLTTMLRLSGR